MCHARSDMVVFMFDLNADCQAIKKEVMLDEQAIVNATMAMSSRDEQELIAANIKMQNPDVVINFMEIFDNA